MRCIVRASNHYKYNASCGYHVAETTNMLSSCWASNGKTNGYRMEKSCNQTGIGATFSGLSSVYFPTTLLIAFIADWLYLKFAGLVVVCWWLAQEQQQRSTKGLDVLPRELFSCAASTQRLRLALSGPWRTNGKCDSPHFRDASLRHLHKSQAKVCFCAPCAFPPHVIYPKGLAH